MKALDINYVNKWTGYKNYRDITNLPVTDIAAGSQNVFIDDGAKLSVRGGSRYLGAEGTVGVQTNPYWSIAHRIHSNYDKFVNGGGFTLPIRMYYSGTTAVGDVLEVYLPTYIAGEAQATKQWYIASQFTTPASPLISNHRWYFAEWWDGVELEPMLVFCAGTNKIRSWTGGYAPITAVGATTLTTNATWESLGFMNTADGGSDTIIVNGVAYVTNGNFTTNTVTIGAGTAGISVNDLAFANIVTYTSPDDVIFDVCSMVNNQVYYIDWRQRNVLVSWNRNQTADLGLPIYQGSSGLNDAAFAGTYTGTTTDDYELTIDSVANTPVTFTGSGANGLVFDTSGYSASGTTHTYKVIVYQRPSTLANTIIYDAATGIFWEGEAVTGGTSGATGVVVYDNTTNKVALTFILGTFVSGEIITGGTSGITATVASFGPDASNFLDLFYIAYRDNVNVASGPLQGPTGQAIAGPFVVANGITFDIPLNIIGNSYPIGGGPYNQYQGFLQSGDTWQFTITSAADTFSWTRRGVTQASNVSITGGVQALASGITVDFGQTTGHALGDKWTVRAYPKIQFGYRNFTFNTPIRYAGEGFKILLDSNGWTMQPQETAMYINGSGGEYYQVNSQLSADLQSETLNVQRLKTEPQFKALYPYLISTMENFVVTIINEKSFNILGRQEFLELPQMRTISDEVKVLFETSNWLDANITYVNTKTFFSLPNEGIVIVYDNFMKYFHAPMVFPRRISNIAFIDGKLCGHSYEKNETYELFTSELNDLADSSVDFAGYAIESKIVFPYYDDEKRFEQKSTNAIAMDGYMIGNPQMTWKINAGVGGCDGTPNGKVDPIVCRPIDTASLGKSSLGFHGLGNSPADVIPHFKYGKTFPPTKYYLKNIELTCVGLEQRWSIVSIGTNVEINDLSNSNMFNISN